MKEKKTGKDSGRLLHAVRVSKFLQVAVLAAGVLGMSAASQSMTEISEKEQPLWQVWSAEECDAGLTVETVGENLILQKKAKLTADSEEGKDFRAMYAGDGNHTDETLRWSSENDWENNDHWLMADFGEPVSIGAVRIYWERTNAKGYALEYSQDKENWQQASVFEEAPEQKEQQIVLNEPVEARYFRLHVTDVLKEESDLSLYYQNVSVQELEVYGQLEDCFVVETPVIEAGSRRTLELPTVPEPYSISFGGADYDVLVNMDEKITDTIADTQVELGFILEKDGETQELPGIQTKIPASERVEADGERATVESDKKAEQDATGEVREHASAATLPEGFTAMEWMPASATGVIEPAGQEIPSDEISEAAPATSSSSDWTTRFIRVVYRDEELERTAQLFATELSGQLLQDVSAKKLADTEKPTQGDIVLNFRKAVGDGKEWTQTLGDEGYELNLEAESPGVISISARTKRGVRWGCVALGQLWEKSEGQLPAGVLRDYPAWSVRGFGIDVGRRPVSLELLYRIAEELSKHQMNTLQIHLNDNQIISQSDYDGTKEGARQLYAGFRLESDVRNKAGQSITSQDLYYSKEEFAQFIEDAAVMGVEVVPEIDTPAHSLALTKVFPKLGLSGDPESVDQLDLSNPAAQKLAETIWSEYLTESDVFSGTGTVHIGMDEYFGNQKAFVDYMKALSDYVAEAAPEKTIRMWGSLSKTGQDYSGLSRKIQLQVWDTDWTDPQEMYDAGFSVINSLSSSLYLIPGGGYDRLDLDFLEKKWQPNVFETQEQTWELPRWSSRTLGACYMLWNDYASQDGNEITEDGLFERFAEPLDILARKLWK
ncbi:MAG: hypothetical protein EGR91_04025 [Lachnospiraceae bacterium]|nr:hypothetical protein [Lachnospiraceae bacterium]